MTLRKPKNTENCKRKHNFALSGEITLEEAMVLFKTKNVMMNHTLLATMAFFYIIMH
jgi:hypothetical protein